MKPADDSPSFGNIRVYLLSSLDFAEDFASNCPDHATDVARFSQELRRLINRLIIVATSRCVLCCLVLEVPAHTVGGLLDTP